MGKYINVTSKGEVLPPFNKAQKLIEDGATRVSDEKFLDNMICVVENGLFGFFTKHRNNNESSNGTN